MTDHRPRHQVTMMDIFIATMVLKVLSSRPSFSILPPDQEGGGHPCVREAPLLLRARAAAKRVAVVACPFCGCEIAASVRKESVAAEPVYELICWQCHAALPETALVSLIDPDGVAEAHVGQRTADSEQ